MKNERGRPRKYMHWDEWQSWLLKEWYPFKTNDFSHLIKRVNFQDIKMNFVLGFLALILALLAIVIVKVV